MENRLSTPLFIINSSYRFFKEKASSIKSRKVLDSFCAILLSLPTDFPIKKSSPKKHAAFKVDFIPRCFHAEVKFFPLCPKKLFFHWGMVQNGKHSQNILFFYRDR